MEQKQSDPPPVPNGAPLTINICALALMLLLTSSRAKDGSLALYATVLQPVLPMIQAGLGIGFAISGLIFQRASYIFLLLSSAALGLMIIPVLYSAGYSVGGDDGGGFFWILIVVPSSIVSGITALVTASMGRPVSGAREEEHREPEEAKVCVSDQKKPKEMELYLGQAEPVADGARTKLPAIWVFFVLVAVFFLWLLGGPISWKTSREEAYVGGIKVQCFDAHELMPLPPPFFHRIYTNHDKVLTVNGRVLLKTDAFKEIYPSPKGTYIVAAHWLHDKPMRIYESAGTNYAELKVADSQKEFPRHYYGYPFTFIEWENDVHFRVKVKGSDYFYGKSQTYKYIWRVDARTGQRVKIESTIADWVP